MNHLMTVKERVLSNIIDANQAPRNAIREMVCRLLINLISVDMKPSPPLPPVPFPVPAPPSCHPYTIFFCAK